MRINKLKHLGAMVLSAALSGNVLADLNDGLVAYYPFDGNAKDESGNGNDGTVNGATLTEDRFRNAHGAYSFNGNEYIRFNNNFISFGEDKNFSVSIWVKIANRCSNSNYCGGILSKMGLSGVIEGYQIGYNNLGVLRFEYYPSNPPSTGTHFHGTTNIVDNSWHLLTITVDKVNDIIKIYTDSRLENTIAESWISGSTVTTNPLYLGMLRGQNFYFTGSIDDVRIYNRALSESEIQQLYNAKEDEEEKPPIEISSKASYDSSTNTLSLEGILVPFIDEFTGKETDNKGIFDAQLAEKTKLVFELIPWSINFKSMFEGEETSGYILYHHKTRTVDIPCFEVTTIAKLGDGIEGKTIYYKDVTMKQRHINYPIFHVEDMTETDSCN
jgi:hypothetical protein